MSKKVSIVTKPARDLGPEKKGADDWVKTRDSAPMKRLTLDVPAVLHAQIKSQCALKGVRMADEIRALLEDHFLKD